MKFADRTRLVRYALTVSSLIILLLILAVSYMHTDYEKKFMENLTFRCDVNDQSVELSPWKDEAQGRYYLFLPSCFAQGNSRVTVNYDENLGTLCVDEMVFRDGDVWENIEDEVVYQMRLSGPIRNVYAQKPMQVLISENLPAVMVTIESEDLLASEDFTNKKYAETGNMLILDETGKDVYEERLERFKIRGNLTATLDKKPFSFTLKSSHELLGMESGLKWNLLANATDLSYIRNKVVLDMANACMDAYEPDGEFVELFLNGEYRGLYLLTEAVNLEENRINISDKNNWFLEMELDFRLEEGMPYVMTQSGQIFVMHSEDMITDSEKQQLQGLLNDIESALYAENGISEVSGKSLEELIDIDSWAEAWLIQEISGDHDTGIASQFAYTLGGKDAPLYAGPVWDYDGSMGNVNTAMFRIPEALTTTIRRTRTEESVNQNRWLSTMYQNEKFREAVQKKYREKFLPKLEEICSAGIDEYKENIGRAAALDALRWNESRLSWSFVLPEDLHVAEEGDYHRFDTLDSGIGMVEDFLTRKKNFLNKIFIEQREYCVVEIRNDAPFLNHDYNQTMYYWVEKDTEIDNMPIIEENGYEFCGYQNLANGEIVTDGTVINEDCVLEGTWKSALF